MIFWLVYDKFEAERNRRYINFYIEKGKEKGIDIRLIIKEEGVDFSNLPSLAIVRTMDPGLSFELESKGVRVCNSSFISRIANDKMETYLYLKNRGINLMETFLVTEDFTPPYYPMVLKPAHGKGGRNVEIINDYPAFLNYRKRVKEKVIAQKAASDMGKDLRVYVVGNRIIKCMLRESDTDFRSNFCLGGKASEYELSPKEREIAENVIAQFNIDYAGIDFIFHNGSPVFNEMEDAVGARMLYTYTDVDIVDIYLDYLLTVI